MVLFSQTQIPSLTIKPATLNEKPATSRTRKWLIITITIVITVLATLLFINLKS